MSVIMLSGSGALRMVVLCGCQELRLALACGRNCVVKFEAKKVHSHFQDQDLLSPGLNWRQQSAMAAIKAWFGMSQHQNKQMR